MNKTTTIRVRHSGGLRFDAAVRGHRIVTDQPVQTGGEDAAPTPLELIGTALASCIALYIVQYCRARQLSSEGLEVAVSQETSKGPYRISAFNVALTLPEGLSAEQREAIIHVARTCPVHNTLMHSPDITVSVDPVASDLIALPI